MVATNKKIFFIIIFFISVLLIFFAKNKNFSNENSLKVYSYSSFSSGAGAALAEIFEKENNIKINFISSDSALIMLTKFKQDKAGADLFIGLDQFTKINALNEIKWKPSSINFDSSYFNIFASGKYLVPYNWSPMTFIYRDGEVKPPTSWQDLADNDYKISVPDPRTSSPGNVFLYWLVESFKNRFGIASNNLKNKVTHWAPSWSSSYGLFTKKNTNLTFSYLTSIAYHLKNGENNYKAASFSTGHPYHVEFVGIPESCTKCDLAKKFMDLMLSEQGQKIIMEKNIMFPVKKEVMSGTVFADIKQIPLLPSSGIKSYNSNKQNLITVWKKVFSETK